MTYVRNYVMVSFISSTYHTLLNLQCLPQTKVLAITPSTACILMCLEVFCFADFHCGCCWMLYTY